MCKEPEKMLTAFQVVFVKWVFLWRARPIDSWGFWLLKPMCALDCVIQLLRRTEGIWWGDTCTSSQTSGWQRQALPWAGWPLVLLSFRGKWNDLWLEGEGWIVERTTLGPRTDHTCHVLTFLLPPTSPHLLWFHIVMALTKG